VADALQAMKRMSDSRFRWLLVMYVITLLTAVGVGFLPGGYSQALADAYAAEPQPWLFDDMRVGLAIAISLLAAIVAGLIGLFRFKRWGRALSLYSTVAGLCLYLFAGPTIQSPIENVFIELSTLLWGAILALSYGSPIARRFDASDAMKPAGQGP
jgi:hypothetical protein